LTSEDFLESIQVLKENRAKEFKRSAPWKEKAFQCKIIKSILALSNLQDGGRIIFGVKQLPSGEFELEGMSDADLATFKEDDVASLAAEYADPFVKIEVNRFKHSNKNFLVIQIDEFYEIPVLCSKDGPDIRRGALYMRSTRIPETVEVPSQTEMREVLDLAVAKNIRKFYRMQALAGIRIAPPQTDGDMFNRQIQDLL
jgi:predicted HTH transcriptional regulator